MLQIFMESSLKHEGMSIFCRSAVIQVETAILTEGHFKLVNQNYNKT